MHSKPRTGLRIRAAAIATAATALTFACASMAQAATTVADPDEPGVSQDRMTNRSVRISFSESPAGAPDTITYSFTSSALGSPRSYRWAGTIRDAGGLLVDRTDWGQTTLGSFLVPKITYEEPIPDLDPDELRILP